VKKPFFTTKHGTNQVLSAWRRPNAARRPNRLYGFTLVELMVTLSIAAILATMATPSISAMLNNNRITTQTNLFIASMTYARSEAIKRGVNINVVASDYSDSSNEWGPGWTVVLASDSSLIKTFGSLEGSSTLNSTNDVNTFQFLPSGRVNVADTLSLCDSRTGETGRTLTVSTTGRVSFADLTCS